VVVEDPDAQQAATPPFVDRVSELEALRSSLLTHRARMDAGLIDTTELRNVLTFYGEGGAGKSELSRRLEDWVAGRDTSEHWSSPPERPADVTVRWDLNDSFGAVDPHDLLVALRSQLGAHQSSWQAFDLAFAAFHQAVMPGTDLVFRSPGGGGIELSDLVTGLVGDALALGGAAATGGASVGIVGLGRYLWARRKERGEVGDLLRKYDGLDQLVLDAEALQHDRERIAEVAGRLMFMLNREIEAIDAAARPTIVVFVDHMERLQTAASRRQGEAVVNRLVSRAPWLLFVISGRNSLRWHEVSDLPVSGPTRWPLLSTESPPVDEPRQHAIGFLAPDDARAFLATSFERRGIAVEDGVIDELANSTDGWPLHLQTIVAVAAERRSGTSPLTLAELEGRLPSLVERLLSDLPEEVADAFRAACLLPYFDVSLAAAAGNVSVGAVERLLTRQLHRVNEGSAYPFRVHDTLRALVRAAGSEVDGGWAEADWARHAGLAMAEASRRFNESIATKDDRAAIDSLALGLNVATEHDRFDDWLVEGVRESPTIHGLAPRISAVPRAEAPEELTDLLEFLALRARPPGDDVTDELLEILHRRTPISSGAGLWRAYDLRARGRVDEALAQLQLLLDEYDDRPALYRNQFVTTLRLDRRFEEANRLLPFLTEAQQLAQGSSLRRTHGFFDGTSEAFAHRVEAARSRRFQVELLGDELAVRHREFGITTEGINAVYAVAVEVGHRGCQAVCLGLLAEVNLFDEPVVADCLDRLEDLSRYRQRTYRAIPHVLAMQALALDDDGLARAAYEAAVGAGYRNAPWISTEILLDHLGHPLDPVETQWLDPYEEVRARWIDVMDQIVDRARRSRGNGG
jgi:hypothetical protein